MTLGVVIHHLQPFSILTCASRCPSAIAELLVFHYEQSYLSIYWTDFHDLFTKSKVFA